jgi:hypothetical protein
VTTITSREPNISLFLGRANWLVRVMRRLGLSCILGLLDEGGNRYEIS